MDGSLLNSISEYEHQGINPVTDSEEVFKRMGISQIAQCVPPKVLLFSDHALLIFLL